MLFKRRNNENEMDKMITINLFELHTTINNRVNKAFEELREFLRNQTRKNFRKAAARQRKFNFLQRFFNGINGRSMKLNAKLEVYNHPTYLKYSEEINTAIENMQDISSLLKDNLAQGKCTDEVSVPVISVKVNDKVVVL